MSVPIDTAEVFGRIRRAIRLAGSQRKFAESVGISQPFLSQMLNCQRPVSDRLLRHVGLRRVVTYVETNGP